MKYTYLGSTQNSLAFRATDTDGISTDYGVFDFLADENGQGEKLDYTNYFAGVETSVAAFYNACETYLNNR